MKAPTDILLVTGPKNFVAARRLASALAVRPLGAPQGKALALVHEQAADLRGLRVFVNFPNDEIGRSEAKDAVAELREVGAFPLFAPCPNGASGFKDIAGMVAGVGLEEAARILASTFAAAGEVA